MALPKTFKLTTTITHEDGYTRAIERNVSDSRARTPDELLALEVRVYDRFANPHCPVTLAVAESLKL